MRSLAKRLGGLALAAGLFCAAPVLAFEGLVEKKVFEMPSYTTVGGGTIKNVRIGWESYGKLNDARDNVILITHFFSGNSHAAGKYKMEDPTPGYWDSIIGPGKPLDTDKFFIVSSDTLVNLSPKDPTVTTTGPASVNPDTGKPYGMSFPVVTIRDFVNVQKALLDSLNVKSLHAVMGGSMGSLQALEWGATHPEMVKRVVAVIGGAEADPFLIGWLNLWAAPIRVDPNWQGGDYYGKAEPKAGLTEALKLVTLHARHWKWADATFGRGWAEEGKDPAASMNNQYAIEAWLDKAAAARAAVSDANHFLYLVKANQTFLVGGGGALDEGLAKIKAPVLLIPSADDLVFPPERAMHPLKERLEKQGVAVTYTDAITTSLGHLDGIANIAKAGDTISAFMAK
ncbi:homoserine O-acetyltransferase [Azospirillum formosense]|uniref:Probable acyltransferase n=1 Tax=Azospirillum formosense TaxID=861533 RepID=A0ABX2KYV2_9PROT|nr:homoserine O-acetyltransferase [Azospirillum formosense]MBY3755396.1 homoserine O-acetyltransferase [Azospirillum formosense]NUB20914.1 homoserine O-acetyltransferase [Azospirillum formosense]